MIIIGIGSDIIYMREYLMLFYSTLIGTLEVTDRYPHAIGIVMSETFGVVKKATAIAVRVLDAVGEGPTRYIFYDYVISNSYLTAVTNS